MNNCNGYVPSLGCCPACSLRPEIPRASSKSIAEVLRLRATKPAVCDRSAKRFAQDDGFVGGPDPKTNQQIKK